LVKLAMENLGLSPGTHNRILRVARTNADWDVSANLQPHATKLEPKTSIPRPTGVAIQMVLVHNKKTVFLLAGPPTPN
jgi:hypothetical protein